MLNQIKGFTGLPWIKQWLTAGVMENHSWSPTTAGTPQGGIISPLLANIALHGMEKILGVKFNSVGYLLSGCAVVVRYADDFVVFHHTKEGCEDAKHKLQLWLAQRGLQFSEHKTHIRHLTQGFDFLGFNIRHYPVKNRKQPYIFLAKPAKSSIQHFRQQIKQAWKQAQNLPIQQVINFINPKLRGWAYYFRIGAAKETFALLDHWCWIRQERFVAKRHPNKNWKWRIAQYWGTIPERKDRWVFQDKTTGAHLLKLAWVPIKRHILVKGNASPDDPTLQDYWHRRKRQKGTHKQIGIKAETASRLLEPNAG